MTRPWKKTGMAASIAILTTTAVLAGGGLAYADMLQDTISGSGAVTLIAGSGISGSAGIRVLATGGDGDIQCNSDPGDAPLVLDIITPAGITANPDPLSFTTCGNAFTTVTFTASSGAVSGTVTVSVQSAPAGGGTYDNQVAIPITVTQPVNTPPTVSVTGVTNGASYEIGSVPTASCAVVDAEDGNSTTSAVLSGALVHGLGSQTATCNYTDAGGLAAVQASRTYTIVDTGNPTISHTLLPASPDGYNGWYVTNVAVDFTCADGGSGVASCTGDTTLGDGENQSATGTATDWAGRTATDTVSGIYVDTIVPNVTHTLDAAAPDGTNGWYVTPVDVDFSCTDGGSGIALCTGDTTLGDGANQSATGTGTDLAGNIGTDTVSGIFVDTADPTIWYTIQPASPNGFGWYTSSVIVTFTCGDGGGSGIESCVGDATLSDGSNQSVTGIATDFAGNTSTVTVSGIDIDTINPTIGHTLVAAAPDGNNGWYRTAVVVDFTCSDGGSGIESCTGDDTFLDGANQSRVGTATDKAGNTATDTVSGIFVDTIDPTISHTLAAATPDGNNGWYRTSVVVDFSCADAGGSGIASCDGDVTLGDGANQSAVGTATDVAGNTETDTVSGIYVDTIDPTISHTLSPSAPNGSGWYKDPVVVDFTCADGGSGVASASCGPDTTLNEGADQTALGTATDNAGRTMTDTVSDIDVDLTPPTVALVGGPSGNYYFGSVPAAPTCIANDALSGLVGCVITGGGTSVGPHSYTATATDVAGNIATSVLNYTVLAWQLSGFYSPVDMGGVWNTVKGGSTVPLKFEVFAASELTSTSVVSSFKAIAVSCPNSLAVTDAIELTTTGGTALRYDSTGGQFIQNWATPKKPGTCARVTLTTLDGSTLVANFIFK